MPISKTLEKNLNKCHIGVLSKGRPKNVLNPIYHTIHTNSTWYVSDFKEAQYYLESVFELKIHGLPFPQIRYGGKLVESRNRIIDDAKSLGKQYAVIVEDDLTGLFLAKSKKEKELLDITQAIDIMINSLETQQSSPEAKMIGVAPTANLFFFNPDKPISINKFCIGSLLVIDTSIYLRFDINMTLKEDYDYSLQHMKRYGKVMRADCIIANFKHYANKGGVVGYRNTEREQQNINYLKNKWGTEVIRDNPRRENEILLNTRSLVINDSP